MWKIQNPEINIITFETPYWWGRKCIIGWDFTSVEACGGGWGYINSYF